MQIDLELVTKLLEVIVSKDPMGAVLIFLPGHDDISKLLNKLTKHHIFGNQQLYLLLPLHSSISSAEQQRVFVRPRQVKHWFNVLIFSFNLFRY